MLSRPDVPDEKSYGVKGAIAMSEFHILLNAETTEKLGALVAHLATAGINFQVVKKPEIDTEMRLKAQVAPAALAPATAPAQRQVSTGQAAKRRRLKACERAFLDVAPRGRDFRFVDISEAYEAVGFSPQSLSPTSSNLIKIGYLARVDRGLYRVAAGAPAPLAASAPSAPSAPSSSVPPAPSVPSVPSVSAASAGETPHAMTHPLGRAILTLAAKHAIFARRHIDKVAQKQGYAAALVTPMLMRLEREGVIAQIRPNRYRMVKGANAPQAPAAAQAPELTQPPVFPEPLERPVTPQGPRAPGQQALDIFLREAAGRETFTTNDVKDAILKAGFSQQAVSISAFELRKRGVIVPVEGEKTGQSHAIVYRFVNGAPASAPAH
jgi:hypothetical protein